MGRIESDSSVLGWVFGVITGPLSVSFSAAYLDCNNPFLTFGSGAGFDGVAGSSLVAHFDSESSVLNSELGIGLDEVAHTLRWLVVWLDPDGAGPAAATVVAGGLATEVGY